jgi:aminoglycoside phosphotransferase (APT) family kinase protein
MPPATEAGQRIRWIDLPMPVRTGVEAILGGTVVSAVPQTGGFSPGTADRVCTAAGRRAFVKAICPARSPRSTAAHRREAQVTAALPPSVAAPRLLGCYDDGDWVALVLEDVPGRHPATPWLSSELERVLATVADLARTPVPPRLELAPASRALAYEFGGWRRIAEDPPADLCPWVSRRLDQLCLLAEQARSAVDGDALVHRDIRSDNVLLGPDDEVTIVDWPWACRGAAWLDTLLLLVNVRLYGGHDTHALLVGYLSAAGQALADPVATIAAFAGYYRDAARQADRPHVPRLRAFQRTRADAALSWLREMLER